MRKVVLYELLSPNWFRRRHCASGTAIATSPGSIEAPSALMEPVRHAPGGGVLNFRPEGE